MENIGWGLQISAIGMGLVFALLAMLWGLLALVMRLDRPRQSPESAGGSGSALLGSPERGESKGMDPDLVAAILIATLAHKAWRRQEAAPLMRAFLPGSQLYASRWVASGRMRQNHSWQRGGR